MYAVCMLLEIYKSGRGQSPLPVHQQIFKNAIFYLFTNRYIREINNLFLVNCQYNIHNDKYFLLIRYQLTNKVLLYNLYN